MRRDFTMEGGEDFLVILFHHPKPTQATQCYYSALVWTKPPEQINDDNIQEAMHPLRYYTLEMSISLEGEAARRCCAVGTSTTRARPARTPTTVPVPGPTPASF